MKKIVKNLAVLIVAGMLLTLSACDLTNLSQATNGSNATSSGASSSAHTGGSVNAEQAKAIVLQHAGFNEADVQFKKVELEDNNGVQKFDIEFLANGKEYDYDINQNDGQIISFDNEFDVANNTTSNPVTNTPNTPPANNNGGTQGNNGQKITLAQAKDIALKHAGVNASQAQFVKSSLKWDDGREEYDIEFFVGNTEYDYEIDAITGRILEFDRDIEYNNQGNNNNATGQKISLAQAKEIALKHAGLSAGNVGFVKAELDRDNGRIVYEVEFYSGNKEYEYDIDANTGQILKSKVDIDD